jgi:hypothetical protein
MAEQFDVCCVFEVAPADVKNTVSELFRAGSSWLGNPESFVLFTDERHFSSWLVVIAA